MKYNKKQIRKAGITLKEDEHDDGALDILSVWRASHASSLETAYHELKKFAIKIDSKAVVAKRLKRTPSIISKLIRFDGVSEQSSGYGSMKLDNMNDIGGCRAIVSTIKKLYQLTNRVKRYNGFKLQKDYIANPKDSGYRGIHLIGKVKNEDDEDRFIEIQLRTKVQHAWATAVEIVDLFTNQSIENTHGDKRIRQSIKTDSGNKEWSNFFKYTSELFALLENNSQLHLSNPQTVYRNFEKLYLAEYSKKYSFSFYMANKLWKKLQIDKKFKAFAESIKISAEQINHIPQPGYVLVTINEIDEKSLGIRSEFFPIDQFDKAIEMYLISEKEYLSHQNFVTALVSTDSIGGIKEAYPNYFADSTIFLNYLHIVMHVYKSHNTYIDDVINTFEYWKNSVFGR